MEKDENNASIFLGYLRKIHFKTAQVKMQHKIMNWTDIILASVYSLISAICIWIDATSFVVVVLNLICLWRAFFDNYFNAVKVTESKETAEIVDKPEKFTYYHLKAREIMQLIIVLAIIVITLAFEKNNTTHVLKVISSISIFFVWRNDLDNILIRAYSAYTT